MIRGQKRALDKQPSVNVNLNASIHNRFDIEVVDAKTGEVKQRAVAYNVICDQIWTDIFSNNMGYGFYILYGDGSGTPSTQDTKLFSKVGYASCDLTLDNGGYDLENGVAWYTRKGVISESEAVGKNLTELGLSSGQSQTNICTHAMLQDMNGNQISIAKTDSDIINVYATVYVHWNTGYMNGIKIHMYEIPIGQTYSDTSYIFLNWILGLTSSPNLNIQFLYGNNPEERLTYAEAVAVSDAGGVGCNITRNLATKTLSATISRLGASVANSQLGGIRGIMIAGKYTANSNSNNANYKTFPFAHLKIDPSWFPGSSITGESVATGDGSTTEFSTKFGYVREGTAVVRVDGQVADCTVDYGKPHDLTNMGIHFDLVSITWGAPGTWSSWEVPTVAEARDTNNDYRYGRACEAVYYNPFYEYGITSCKKWSSNVTLSVSDDMTTWVEISSSRIDNLSIPEAYQHYKYWKLTAPGTGDVRGLTLMTTSVTPNNIHFATPPADGAVITVDYISDTIAKDENHVFDFTFNVQLGEYTE